MPSVTMPAPFTAAGRALIRYEFMRRFGQAPLLADGIWLRTWKSGPLRGQPKLPPALASMRERGLVEVLQGTRHGARAVFTQAGLDALRLLARDRRALDREGYAHLRQELGVDLPGGAAAAERHAAQDDAAQESTMEGELRAE